MTPANVELLIGRYIYVVGGGGTHNNDNSSELHTLLNQYKLGSILIGNELILHFVRIPLCGYRLKQKSLKYVGHSTLTHL